MNVNQRNSLEKVFWIDRILFLLGQGKSRKAFTFVLCAIHTRRFASANCGLATGVIQPIRRRKTFLSYKLQWRALHIKVSSCFELLISFSFSFYSFSFVFFKLVFVFIISIFLIFQFHWFVVLLELITVKITQNLILLTFLSYIPHTHTHEHKHTNTHTQNTYTWHTYFKFIMLFL